MENYHLSIPRILLGDLETALSINTIILITEEVIYNPMKKEQKPHFINVENDIKKFHFEEKYRYHIWDKGSIFDKQYILLSNIYVKT